MFVCTSQNVLSPTPTKLLCHLGKISETIKIASNLNEGDVFLTFSWQARINPDHNDYRIIIAHSRSLSISILTVIRTLWRHSERRLM